MILWNCLGDSITDDIYVPFHYYTYILEKYPNVKMKNYGIAGTRIGGHRVCGEDEKMMCRRYKEMESADLITVWGGVNDWGQKHPTLLGEIHDRTEDTFYGALRILCEGLIKQFPTSQIVFITPIGNDGYEGFAVYENEFGFTPHNPQDNKLYFIDGLHLSTLGHEKISHIIEENIKQYILGN